MCLFIRLIIKGSVTLLSFICDLSGLDTSWSVWSHTNWFLCTGHRQNDNICTDSDKVCRIFSDFCLHCHIWIHTNGSNVLMSFNLLPLRFRCVRLGSFSAKTSRPPLILLSLNSSWKISGVTEADSSHSLLIMRNYKNKNREKKYLFQFS